MLKVHREGSLGRVNKQNPVVVRAKSEIIHYNHPNEVAIPAFVNYPRVGSWRYSLLQLFNLTSIRKQPERATNDPDEITDSEQHLA